MRRKTPVILAVVASVGLLGLLGYGLTRDARLAPVMLADRPAPAFALETLDGDTLHLSELRGEVVVLNFWASWCIPCAQEHPVLLNADRELRSEGVRVVGIVYQDTPSNARRWMEEGGGDWPILLDPGSRTAIEYGISGVPETFFIARDGRLAHKHLGAVTRETLVTWLPRLMREDAPAGDRPGRGDEGERGPR